MENKVMSLIRGLKCSLAYSTTLETHAGYIFLCEALISGLLRNVREKQ